MPDSPYYSQVSCNQDTTSKQRISPAGLEDDPSLLRRAERTQKPSSLHMEVQGFKESVMTIIYSYMMKFPRYY
jgi:hypothetical protein